MSALANRHDILILFDGPTVIRTAIPMRATSRVSTRRLIRAWFRTFAAAKIRNYVAAFKPKDIDGRGYDIMIQQGAVINNVVNEAEQPAAKKANPKTERDRFELRGRSINLCNRFYDLRTFGMVLSTGNKIFKGSAYGQVRGPVQFTFARSLDPITPLEISITRCR